MLFAPQIYTLIYTAFVRI